MHCTTRPFPSGPAALQGTLLSTRYFIPPHAARHLLPTPHIPQLCKCTLRQALDRGMFSTGCQQSECSGLTPKGDNNLMRASGLHHVLLDVASALQYLHECNLVSLKLLLGWKLLMRG